MLSSKTVKTLVARVAKWQDRGMGKKALGLGPVGLRCIAILQEHAAAQKITNAWIAEQVELSESTISRVFNGLRALTVDELDAVADALGLVGWQVLREAEEPAHNVVEFLAPSVSSIAAHQEPLRWREQTDQ